LVVDAALSLKKRRARKMRTLKVLFFFVLMAIGMGACLSAMMTAPLSIGYPARVFLWAVGIVGVANLFHTLGFEEGVWKANTPEEPIQPKLTIVK
jgi:hypothetical protein